MSTPSPTIAAPTPTPSATFEVRDGEAWIAYQWFGSDARDGIVLIRPDGTGRHHLIDLEGAETHPDWSPDGQRIAFIREAPTREELWAVDADGSDAAMLWACELPCNSITLPDWAPDGSAIYFGIDANPTPEGPPATFGVGRFDLASGQMEWVLTKVNGLIAEMPRVSPDGRRVAYVGGDLNDEASGTAIVVADLAGGTEQRLTDGQLFAAHPDWSPDGRIVFNTFDAIYYPGTTERGDLFTIASDGTDLRPLADLGDETHPFQPRWTPDGSGVVFTSQSGTDISTRSLAYVDADGTGARWLTPDPVNGTHPQLRPIPTP